MEQDELKLEELKFQQRKNLHFLYTPLGVIEWDADFKVCEWNPAAEKMFGYKRSEAIGKYAFDLIIPFSAKDQIDKAWSNLKDGKGGHRSTNENICKDKSEIMCEWYNTPLFLEDGTFLGVASLVQDITNDIENQKTKDNLQKQLYHNSKLSSLGELAAGIAHEINNPLTIIKGQISVLEKMMKKGISDPEKYYHALEIQNESIDRIKNIVNGLRTYARTDTSHLEVVDVHNVILDTIVLIKNLYQNNDIELRTVLDAKQNLVSGNIGKLQQILMNIFSNSKDAIEKHSRGLIRIETINENDNLVVIITDNGQGMEQGVLNRIYDTFFSTKTPGSGTGLGMSIVQSLVQEHKGDISLDSEVGIGTKCKITFPVVESDAIDESTEDVTEEKEIIDARILVVDDEEHIRNFLSEEIEEFGAKVDNACDGEVALKMLEAKKYDIVVTDLKMPRLSGEKLISIMHERGYLENCKVVVITGGIITEYSNQEREILRKLASGYIKKPFSTEIVYKTILDLVKT